MQFNSNIRYYCFFGLWLLGSLCVDGVVGFSDGAPDDACDSMNPGHEAESLELSESPYDLELNFQTKLAIDLSIASPCNL